jgi:alcohol dehydrogenase class IV
VKRLTNDARPGGSVPPPFSYEALPGRVVFGPGRARHALVEEADRLGAQRIVLIATGREEPLARELAAPLGGRIVAVFTAVRPHVPVAVAEAARALATSVAADALLSVGGGSTTGTAKAVALTSGLPIIAVPTTYAGSEVTPVWGLTEQARKTTGTDSRVLPRSVVYDPELTTSLPVELSAASGLNAMAHCVEAFWAPGANPLSSLAAEEGIRALATGLPAVVAAPGDAAARGDLLYGAYLAGSAFAVAGSGLHHKICHTLGGALDLPHAMTHAIVLPHVLAFNAPEAPEAAARIGRALGTDDPVAGLRALAHRLGIPAGLRALGMPEDAVDDIAATVAPLVPASNPRTVDRAALRTLIHAAWAGSDESPNNTQNPNSTGRPTGRGSTADSGAAAADGAERGTS